MTDVFVNKKTKCLPRRKTKTINNKWLIIMGAFCVFPSSILWKQVLTVKTFYLSSLFEEYPKNSFFANKNTINTIIINGM